MTAIPVDPAHFAAAMARVADHRAARGIAVALSGGGDSLALALLLKHWAAQKRYPFAALTVDHGLRAASRAEAEAAAAFCAAQGIEHRILSWEGEKPNSGTQEKARRARYALLIEACRSLGLGALALAHNLEDQAETFWMRLSHGSGLDGLTGMPESREEGGVLILRPVMGFSRESLRATCRENGVRWIEDPSNVNEKFLRPRLRKFEDLLATEGFGPARLAATMKKLERVQDALEEIATKAFADGAQAKPEGAVVLDLQVWRAQPLEIRCRVLLRALRHVRPADYPPGSESLDQVVGLLGSPGFSGCTLAGCEILPAGPETVWLVRESAAQASRILAVSGAIWDGRFVIEGTSGGFDIGPLGDEGFAWLRKNGVLLPALAQMPFRARRVLPAFWRGGDLVSIPHLGWRAPGAPETALRLRIRAVV